MQVTGPEYLHLQDFSHLNHVVEFFLGSGEVSSFVLMVTFGWVIAALIVEQPETVLFETEELWAPDLESADVEKCYLEEVVRSWKVLELKSFEAALVKL